MYILLTLIYVANHTARHTSVGRRLCLICMQHMSSSEMWRSVDLQLYNTRHGVIFQKTWILFNATMRTWNLACFAWKMYLPVSPRVTARRTCWLRVKTHIQRSGAGRRGAASSLWFYSWNQIGRFVSINHKLLAASRRCMCVFTLRGAKRLCLWCVFGRFSVRKPAGTLYTLRRLVTNRQE
jgi:hypothetical protein